MKRIGRVSGRPRIKVGYGQNIGRVQKNIRRQTRMGGLKVSRGKQFGYGG